jgi:ABC-2 type transport system ATP-binding protein
VANGTPAELKQRSHNAGSVRVRFVGGVPNMIERLSQLPLVAKVDRVNGSYSSLRVMGKERNAAPELSRAIGELAARERWTIEELLVEEGRLDDVFRSITLPDTTQRI